MNYEQVIIGPEAIQAVSQALSRIPSDPLHEVIIREWEPPGSNKQIRAIHKWYGEIALDRPEMGKDEWERYCKYHIGIPILIEEPQYFEFFRRFFEGFPKTEIDWYEQRLKAMRFVGVVSEMNRKQRSLYMNNILGHEEFRFVNFTIPPPKDERFA